MKHAIVIIGGYQSLWPQYRGLARALTDVTGRPVVCVPTMPWDWWSAIRRQSATHIMQKVERTVNRVRGNHASGRVTLVAHSAGGLIARLFLADQPAWGRHYAGLECVDALITLGTPHCCSRRPAETEQPGTLWFLVDLANRLVPGATYADRVRYRAVAGSLIQGRADGSPSERRAYLCYQFFGPQAGETWGDGAVPIECARLQGAENLVLADVSHSQKYGRRWYGGSKEIVLRWWPQE